MNTTNSVSRLRQALAAPSSSARLQAALAAGTHPNEDYVEALVERSAIEPDFFVRDMLTWALTRHPAELIVPRLLEEAFASGPQPRSQALHTLSKIGDPRGWDVATSLLRDPDDEVARSAWRTAVALVPEGSEHELALALATQLGRGDRELQRSLSRALAALGDWSVLDAAENDQDPLVRAHAIATSRLLADPDADFDAALTEATRQVVLAGAPRVDDDADW